MMLESIPDIFKSFFIPEEKGIFKVCPSKKYMYGLLYSLDKYDELMLDYLSQSYVDKDNILIDLTEARMAIRHVIDNLIGIELTMENDDSKLEQYADKFMDLISSNLICDIMAK